MRLKITFLILFITILTVHSFAQGIPDQWNFKNNHTYLEMGKRGLKNLYNDSIIRKFELTFPQSNYWQLLTQNKAAGINIPATLTYEGVDIFDSVGVRFKGNTSYSQANGDKKSFNIELDWVKSGADINGYNTLNLNNAFKDNSMLRELMYMFAIRNHVPALKTGMSKLYINGENWGFYPNVQQLNRDMYKDWFNSDKGVSWRAQGPSGGGGPGPGGPNWGDGTTALNYLGASTALYTPNYIQKFSDYTNPYDELVTLCDKLNNTPLANLEDTMKVYMDLDRTLWFLASEIAFTDDDGYVYKGKQDYYVFKEMETGQMVPMEYDGNSPMAMNKATSWSPFYNANKVNYPLLNRLLQVPSIRQRYLAHMRTIIAQEFDQTTFDDRLDYYVSQIDTVIQNDPKKFMTYNQFQSDVNVLKNFISTRRNYLNSNAEVAEVAPVITNASHYINNVQWTRPASNQMANIKANVASSTGIDAVNLYYSAAINGQFTKVTMYDDGLHNDGGANDGEYGASIPGFTGGTWVRYYVEAVANNTSKSVAYMPVGAEHDVYVYLVVPDVNANEGIVINEIMPSNQAAVADGNGEFDDWIELYNTSAFSVDLSGWTLTDDQFNLTKYTFPNGTIMSPNSYQIIWADEDGSQGWDHSNFKLDADGEELYLLNTAGEYVDQVTWNAVPADQGYARDPNGTGNFVVKYQTFNINNNWPVAVENIDKDFGFKLFPNPAKNFVTIQFSENIFSTDYIKIMDISGKQIASIPYAQEVRVNTENFANGMYLMRFGSTTKKFVVQH